MKKILLFFGLINFLCLPSNNKADTSRSSEHSQGSFSLGTDDDCKSTESRPLALKRKSNRFALFSNNRKIVIPEKKTKRPQSAPQLTRRNLTTIIISLPSFNTHNTQSRDKVHITRPNYNLDAYQEEWNHQANRAHTSSSCSSSNSNGINLPPTYKSWSSSSIEYCPDIRSVSSSNISSDYSDSGSDSE